MGALPISDELERDLASLDPERREVLLREAERYIASRIRRDRSAMIRRFDEIAALTPDVPQTDSATLLREDRTR